MSSPPPPKVTRTRTKYISIFATDLETLDAKVNEHLKKDWELHGILFYAANAGYVQAMVKEKEVK
jgi:hypothetical protein